MINALYSSNRVTTKHWLFHQEWRFYGFNFNCQHIIIQIDLKVANVLSNPSHILISVLHKMWEPSCMLDHHLFQHSKSVLSSPI